MIDQSIAFTAAEIRMLDTIIDTIISNELLRAPDGDESTLPMLRGKVRVALNRIDPRRQLDELADDRGALQQSPQLLRVLDEVGGNVHVRTREKLLNGGIRTLAQLLDCDRYALLRINGFGSACLAEVEKALAKFGLELKP